jgi:hypothetical protein
MASRSGGTIQVASAKPTAPISMMRPLAGTSVYSITPPPTSDSATTTTGFQFIDPSLRVSDIRGLCRGHAIRFKIRRGKSPPYGLTPSPILEQFPRLGRERLCDAGDVVDRHVAFDRTAISPVDPDSSASASWLRPRALRSARIFSTKTSLRRPLGVRFPGQGDAAQIRPARYVFCCIIGSKHERSP